MELLDNNWEYYVNYNNLYKQDIQLNKLDRSKVLELANYDLTELFEIYDQININSKLFRNLNFQQLKSKIINRLKELKINYEIKNFGDQLVFHLKTSNITIIIKRYYESIDKYVEEVDIEPDYKSTISLQFIKWNKNHQYSSDHILFTEDRTEISFVAKDKYRGDLFTYFEIPADPKERYMEQNYWKFNTQPPKIQIGMKHSNFN